MQKFLCNAKGIFSDKAAKQLGAKQFSAMKLAKRLGAKQFSATKLAKQLGAFVLLRRVTAGAQAFRRGGTSLVY